MPRDGSLPEKATVKKEPEKKALVVKGDTPAKTGAGSEAPLWAIAKIIQQYGGDDDTVLAHISKKEAARLKAAGGSGEINEITGLPKFNENGDGGAGGSMGADDRGTQGGDNQGGNDEGRVGGGQFGNEGGVDTSIQDTPGDKLAGGPGDDTLGGFRESDDDVGLDGRDDRGVGTRIGDFVNARVQNAVKNPIEVFGDLAFSMVPGFGLVNSISGAFGGPTVGGVAQGMARSAMNGPAGPYGGADGFGGGPTGEGGDGAMSPDTMAFGSTGTSVGGAPGTGASSRGAVDPSADGSLNQDLASAADAVQTQGRYGDDELVHMSGDEISDLSQMSGITPTINPTTGKPEFFNFGKFLKSAAPVLGGLVGYGLGSGSGAIGSALGAGVGTGVGSLAAGNSAGTSFKNALLGGVSGGALGLAGGFSGIGDALTGSGFGGTGGIPQDLGASAGGSASAAPTGLGSGGGALEWADPELLGDTMSSTGGGAIGEASYQPMAMPDLQAPGAGMPAAAAGGGGAAPAAFNYNDTLIGKSGLPQNAITEAVAKNPGAAIAGTGLAYNMLGSQSLQGQEDLEKQARELGLQGSELAGYLKSGTLPPGAKAAIDTATSSAKAAVRSKYAAMGMSGSTSELAELNDIDLRAAGQSFQIASELLRTGINSTGLSSRIYESLMNVDQKQAASTGTAIGNFAAALNGAAPPGSNQGLTLRVG